MESFFENLIIEYKDWFYLIIFVWCMMEGELALVFAGIMAHHGHVNLFLSIFIAGLGAFCGDQIYFYIGRYNKKYIQKKLTKQKRKFAIAHLLLQKYGWPVIFIQRYMYGFRTVIPMSIGITRYDAKKFAFINLISAWVWATITILLAWYFGELIWEGVHFVERHWYYALPLIGLFLCALLYGFKQIEKTILKEREKKKNEIPNPKQENQ